MGYTKPKPLREIGFNTEAMNMAANSDVVITLDRWAKERVARRDFSVFDQLATNGKTVGTVVYKPTLSKAMAVAGNNMFAVYAAWKGLAGAPEKPTEYVQSGRSEPELLTDRMMEAGDEWRAILSHMKSGNASLLAAICHDMLHANGAMLDVNSDRPVVRWRRVVQTVCGTSRRQTQQLVIFRMCSDLMVALEKRPLSIMAY